MAEEFTSPLAQAIAPDLLERFLRYVRIDTQSRRERERSPSTPGQLELGRLLVSELKAVGLEDAALDENGYVTATLLGERRSLGAPADGRPAAPFGVLAHLDTSPDAPGAGVEPIVHHGYDGGVIELPRGGTRLDPAAMPELRAKVGHDLVTSSGDTLLGADDKAGVAAIMAAVAYLAAHPERGTADAASRVHARRGDRRGSDAVRHRALRRSLCLHDRRLHVSASFRTRRSRRSR